VGKLNLTSRTDAQLLCLCLQVAAIYQVCCS